VRVWLLLLLVSAGSAAHAACPCYSLTATPNTHNCGVEAAPGSNPTVAEWQPIFDEVSRGPAAWGTDGPSLSTIHAGCNKPMPPLSVSAVFPCELLRAIAMNESGWTQFCKPTTPASQVGLSSRTIISFDCVMASGK